MSNPIHTQHNQDGITLLVTLILMGVLMGISASLLNVTMKQFQLSGIAYSSEVAFQAANAGMECALFHDLPANGSEGPFMVNGDGLGRDPVSGMICMGQLDDDIVGGDGTCEGCDVDNSVESGEEQRFQFTWGSSPTVCSEVSIYKFYSTTVAQNLMVGTKDMRLGSPCPIGGVCTVVQSRGYNVACNQITSGSRAVEREYTQVY